MAINLIVSASTPNAAYSYLQYVVTGSGPAENYTNNQYKFIMDVYISGSTDKVARVTQPPNLNTGSVFNPADIFQQYAFFDYVWDITGSVLSTGSMKNYTLQFGEQYGTSPSSSLTVYPNLVSSSIAVIPAIDNSNDNYIGIKDFQLQLESEVLTNMPSNRNGTQTIVANDDWENIQYQTLNDYMTLSSLKSGSLGNNTAHITVVDVNGNNLSSVAYPLVSGGDYVLHHLGCGPKNIIDKGGIGATAIQHPSASYVNIVFHNKDIQYRLSPNYQNNQGDIFADGIVASYGKPYQCGDYTRFAWINEYGVYDYYNVWSPLRKRTEINKEQLTESRINYWLGNTTNASVISQNKKGRGTVDLYKQYKDIYQISTEYIPEVTANWIKFMFFSPSVFIQTDNGFLPIVITNSNYKVNTQQSANKLFQYEIEFVYAKARRSKNYVGKLEYDQQ
jgi:hypothetical protein